MDLSRAVKKTIAYSNYFQFPLSPKEIHRWLISSQIIPFKDIKKHTRLLSSEDKKRRIVMTQIAKEKEMHAITFVNIAKHIPGIKLIALTGSVSVYNCQDEDDIDLFIITSPHTLWLVRPVVIALLSLKFARRHPRDHQSKTKNAFCPNLWLDTTALSLFRPRRNLYTAHEILQSRALFDKDNTHTLFIKSNQWVKHYLANAYSQYEFAETTHPQENKNHFVHILNTVLFILQHLYMFPKKTTEQVSLHYAFFHKNNPSSRLDKALETIRQNTPTKEKIPTSSKKRYNI